MSLAKAKLSNGKGKKRSVRFNMIIGYPGKTGTVCRSDIVGLGGCGKVIGRDELCFNVSGWNVGFRQHVVCHLKWLEGRVAAAVPPKGMVPVPPLVPPPKKEPRAEKKPEAKKDPYGPEDGVPLDLGV